MSNDFQPSNYNLRSKRIGATMPITPAPSSEGFILASELLRRHQCGTSGASEGAQIDQEQVPASKELVSDIPPECDSEGGGTQETQRTSSTGSIGHQGNLDSAGAPPGRPASPPHSPLAEKSAEDLRQEVLRLRVKVGNYKILSEVLLQLLEIKYHS